MCRAETAYFELGEDGVREGVEKDIERFDAAMEGVFVAEEGVKKPFCARDSRSRRRRADAESNLRKAIIIISSFKDFAPKAISTLNCCLCSVFRPTFIFKKSSHFHKDVFSHYLDDICVWQSLALAAHCEERQEVAETRWLGFTTSNLKKVKVLSLKGQKSFLFGMGVGWKFLPCDQLLAMVGHLGPGLFREEEVAAKDCSCGFLVRLLKMRFTIFYISWWVISSFVHEFFFPGS